MTANNVTVTGANGQLGKTLRNLWPTCTLSKQWQLKFFDRSELDITNTEEIEEKLSQTNTNIILNLAAYTLVDQAETDSQIAFSVNECAVKNLASWAAANDARLIHVSTDFVFDGTKREPYCPEDQVNPLGVYGASKLAGEHQLQRLLPDRNIIIRTSWLYSEHGNNFVKTMIRLMSQRDQLSVVDDQIGAPTSTRSLAELLLACINGKILSGLYHWNDGGGISWFEFATAIQQEAINQSLLTKQIPIQAIATSDYPTTAKRPAYSVLDRLKTLGDFDCPQTNWKQQLRIVIDAIANAENIEE